MRLQCVLFPAREEAWFSRAGSRELGRDSFCASSLRTRDTKGPRRLNAGRPTSARRLWIWGRRLYQLLKEWPAYRLGRRASGLGCPWSQRADSRSPETRSSPVSAQQWAWGWGDGLSTSAGPVPPWPRLHSPSWLYCVSAAVHFFALSSPHHGISWGLEVREVTSGGRRSVPADSSPRPGRWGDAHPCPRARAQAREGEDVCWGHSQWSVALAVSAGLYHCRLSSACSKGFDIVTPVGWFRIFQHRCVESSVWTLSAFLSQVRKCGMALETQANLVLSRVCR